MDKLLYNAEEAGDMLGVSRRTIYQLFEYGKLESVLIGKCRRVPRQALEDYVERIRTEQSSDAA